MSFGGPEDLPGARLADFSSSINRVASTRMIFESESHKFV